MPKSNALIGQSNEKTERLRDYPVETSDRLIVLLDTSFFLMMLEQKRDIDDEVRDLVRGPAQISTLDLAERELQHIGRTHASKVGGLANAALELLKKRKYTVFVSKFETSDTDAGIVSFSLAEKQPVAVATVDRKLRASLGKLGVSVISPRRRTGLILTMGARPSST